METYLTPLYTLEPLLDHAGGSILKIDWIAIAGVVLITVGQTLKTSQT